MLGWIGLGIVTVVLIGLFTILLVAVARAYEMVDAGRKSD